MESEQKERDPFEAFEAFGEPEVTLQEIDLSQSNEIEAFEPRPIETVSIDTAEVAAATPKKITGGFSWAGFGGGLAALVWIGGAIGGPVSYYGVDALMALDPALQAGLIALAFGPAVLFWLGGAAAGEALKARRFVAELTRLAQEPNTPFAIGEGHAQRFTLSVKTEIDALNDAVTTALSRLNDLESSARRNAALFDDAIAASRDNAEYMVGRLANERDALTEVNGELRGQTENVANSISRQVRLMREASKLVKTEITSAEEALEGQLASFNASATTMADRTASFHDAADAAAAATASLNNTMSGMLDGLGEATRLTDAARQSSEQAVLAANETANAVRETTRHAVFEAKRAAQVIRAETEALQETAASTMERLRDAAVAARAAAEESQAAADRHATSIEKRLAALAQTAGAVKKPAPAAAPAPVAAPRVEARPVVAERKPVQAPVVKQREVIEEQSLYTAASAAVSRGQGRVQQSRTQETVSFSEARTERSGGGFKGFGGWGNLFPQREESFPMQPAANAPEQADAFALVDFEPTRKDPDTELKADAIDLVEAAGVDIEGSLSAADLERVAQRSRLGAVARRRAVADAAPAAVGRIARHLKRNAEAKLVAAEFRARPDLAKSEKKGEASELVRAYLLIDAALD
ncbi:MAG: hypothetical protein WDM79_07845 [Terricaulis sp.]